jgi:hypothetical protein
MVRIIIVCLFLVALALSVRCEINTGYTAEWIAHQSFMIALATPVKVENIQQPGKMRLTRVQFRLDDLIKGPESTGDLVTVYDYVYQEDDQVALANAQKEKKQLLICCQVSDDRPTGIIGKYVIREEYRMSTAYYAGQPVKNLYTSDFHLLTRFEDLLARVREQVRYEDDQKNRYRNLTIVRKSLEVPMGTEAYHALYAGSACYLFVPDYRRTDRGDALAQ